jgi:hypothetical protein
MKRKEKAELVVTQWINTEVKIWGGDYMEFLELRK